MTTTDERCAGTGFRHEALLYSSRGEFLDRTTRFIRDGVDRKDAILVVVDAPKIDRIRAALNGDARRVEFADMRDIGRNPACIIEAWHDFLVAHGDSGRRIRGIGEPISPDRSEAALVECHIHESLLNVAFETEPDFWLMCPYDTETLSGAVVARGIGNHPFVSDRGELVHHRTSPENVLGYMPPLPSPPAQAERFSFDASTIRTARENGRRRARAAGVDDERVAGLVLAVSEVATNTVVHGGGYGDASVWLDDDSFLCELRGPGRITDPMVGRLRPTRGQMHGYGIWLANQFCDLVQIRSNESGTTVRLHLARGDR